MSVPKVLNRKDISQEDYINLLNAGNTRYVGRPGKWGNLFSITKERTRRETVEQYRTWLLADEQRIKDAKEELSGKDLVCWCAPEACHADVLLEIANET